MRTFAIDLYLWYEPAEAWLLIPPWKSTLVWGIKLSQSEILSCEAGLTFRVDDVLCVGNERDIFSLEMVYDELSHTLDTHKPGELLASFPVGEYLTNEIKLSSEGEILLTRYNCRERTDYYEHVAHFVGTYYKDFPIPRHLWEAAVNRTLDGLAAVFGNSEKLEEGFDMQGSPVMRWLLKRYQQLS